MSEQTKTENERKGEIIKAIAREISGIRLVKSEVQKVRIYIDYPSGTCSFAVNIGENGGHTE